MSEFAKDFASFHRKRYYTKKGEPRKIIPCLDCKGTMHGHLEDSSFISGDFYIYECRKCKMIDKEIL